MLRKLLIVVLPVLGSFILLYGATGITSKSHQLVFNIVGFFVLLVGAWRLYEPYLPNKRRYMPLRAEVDHFIELVRQLNTAAELARERPLPQHRRVCEEVKSAMHSSVEQMALVAGVISIVESTPGKQSLQKPREETSNFTSTL